MIITCKNYVQSINRGKNEKISLINKIIKKLNINISL